MLRIRTKNEEKLPNIFQADIIRRQIGESLPVIIHGEYKDINANTTEAILRNDNLIHTRELGIVKKKKYNYITALLIRGIRIIKHNNQ